MRTYLIWPLLVILFGIGDALYEQSHSCTTGILTVSCSLGQYIFSAMLIESVIVYTIIIALIRILKKRRDTFWTWKEYLSVGVISIVIVFGGVIWMTIPQTRELKEASYLVAAMSYPFSYVAFASMEWVGWIQKVLSSIRL